MPEHLDEGYRADVAVVGETHDLDDGRHEVVVDFPHEVLDSYRTDWGRGCFDDSLTRLLPPMVWNHDPSDLIGRAYRHEALGDRTRLRSRFSDFDAVPRARQAFAQIRDGDIPGWSFHFKRGQSIAHPSIRGARRYVKADMLEFSPVTFPTIPGAQSVGVRSEGPSVLVPSFDQLLALLHEGMLDSDGFRALVVEHYPHLGEHITLRTQPPPQPDPLDGVRAAVAEAGLRNTVLRIADDGAVSTGDTTGNDEDAKALAAAVDEALAQAKALLEGSQRSEPDAQQAAALVNAAGVATEELLAVLGVEKAPSGTRAEDFSTRPWNFDASAYTIDQLKRACLVVDNDGATKDDCHLPVREPDGTLNRAAVHAAAGALAGARGGVNISDDDKHKAASALVGLYAKLGEKPTPTVLRLAGKDEGGRSEAYERLAARFAS